ncbi:signal transduction histidine kinase [Streptomyces sp. 3211.6]|uniref:ATP-binding protein n=1 Tax=Streptomyces TaxID=1883 RepID=UPI000F24C032|nr:MULTISPECIES: ATP-binding protein [Streptomyces]RKT03606.1 signal transduction histidine kinase [Streptomyces sp. 3211.6]RPF39475.1 signal transduction histidine kinase [Streptomyces sp. Ag109_G2-6]
MTTVSTKELRTTLQGLEIFAALTEDQLDWLVSVSHLRVLADGEVLFRDGDEATCFHVLVSGGLVVTKVVDGREEVLTRHSTEEESAAADEHDGKPTAAHRFTGELPLLTDGSYVATASASGPATTVVAYPKPVFFEMLTRCNGVAAVLIPVLAWRIKSSEVQARKRATVEALGTLAAGLAHELNNPAAAVARAAQELVPALDRLTATAYGWGAAATDAERGVLERLAGELDRLPPPETTDPLAQADAEEEITDWAQEAGAARPGLLGSGASDLGLELEWLLERLEGIGEASLAAALDHLAALLEARSLAAELRAAGPRISQLVAATRDYANLDRAPEQRFAVTDGLENTLVVLRSKLAGITIVRAYEPDLPELTGYPGELNQVWTNLVDNAAEAMEGAGTLTLRCHAEGVCMVVEITDTGRGIPEDVLPRIFEPFYTTKDVGKGTGLGLHLSYRIVTQRHHGSITARSRPGETRMLVRLPLAG